MNKRPVEVVIVDEWLDHPDNQRLFELVPEAERRMGIDGIPRYVAYIDGEPTIRKMDWQLHRDALEEDNLEEHVERLINATYSTDNLESE